MITAYPKYENESELINLDRKCALITGGSRGIGRGIATVFARQGYDVAITYASRLDEAEETQRMVEAEGGKCYIIKAELHREGAAEVLVRQAIALLGHIDALVNNAGLTRHESAQTFSAECLSLLYNLNFRSYLICIREVSRHMIKRGIKGAIVSITSTRSQRAYPRDAMYGGLKSGINRATESMALDLAPYGIRINCVLPGATKVRFKSQDLAAESLTGYLAPLIPLARFGLPEDVGEACAFLCSDKAAYITGATLRVDGGLILPGMPESDKGNGWGGGLLEKTWDDTTL